MKMTKIKLIKNCKSIIFIPISVLLLFILIRLNRVITESVIYAIRLCVTTIIPSIFPFFIFADYLGAQRYNGFISRTLSCIFGVTENCCPALFCGLICGFPCGVKWSVNLYNAGLISKNELENLIGVVNLPSFAFIVCSVGIGMLKSLLDGVALYLILLLSVLITSRNLCFKSCKTSKTQDVIEQKFNLSESIKHAGFSSLVVSSYIIFFSIIIKVISFFIKNQTLISIISSFLEIGNATYLISSLNFTNPLLQYCLIGFSIGFSGLSVHLQAFSLLPPNISKKSYFLSKISQGILCALLFTVYKILQK